MRGSHPWTNRKRRQPARSLGLLVAGGVGLFPCAQQAAAQDQLQGPAAQLGRDTAPGCPDALQNPALGRIADRVARNLAGQITTFKTRTALVLIRQGMASAARLELPFPDYTANKVQIDHIDRAAVTACWPKLAAVLAQAPDAATPVTNPAYDSGDRSAVNRAQQAEQRRANEAASQAQTAELQRRAEEIDARVAARLQKQQQRQAEIAAGEQEERARQAETAQRKREEFDRQQQADLTAAREQAAARDADAARRRKIAEDNERAEQERQAAQLREQQAALIREQEAAAARSHLEEQTRKVAEERDRLEAERLAANAEAERQKRPECREADRIAKEEAIAPGLGAVPTVLDIVQKLRAGLRDEACQVARKTSTSAERVRSATARCAVDEAIPYNELATAMRDIILEQGC